MISPFLAAAVQIAALQAELAETRDLVDVLIAGLDALRDYADQAAMGAAARVGEEIVDRLAQETAPRYPRAASRRPHLSVVAGGAA